MWKGGTDLCPGPSRGFIVTRNRYLNQPLVLTVAPNGDVITDNGGNGLEVETTPFGAQVANAQLDDTGTPPGAGRRPVRRRHHPEWPGTLLRR